MDRIRGLLTTTIGIITLLITIGTVIATLAWTLGEHHGKLEVMQERRQSD